MLIHRPGQTFRFRSGEPRYEIRTMGLSVETTFFALRAQHRESRRYHEWSSRVVNGARTWFAPGDPHQQSVNSLPRTCLEDGGKRVTLPNAPRTPTRVPTVPPGRGFSPPDHPLTPSPPTHTQLPAVPQSAAHHVRGLFRRGSGAIRSAPINQRRGSPPADRDSTR